MKKLIYVFLSLIILCCKSQKVESIVPTGTYTLGNYNAEADEDLNEYFGKIQVKQINTNRILMTFMVNKGAPSYNSGSFVDTLDYRDSRAIYTNIEIDPDCRIIFDFTETGVTVKEQTDDYNSVCGFGHAVVADGFFRKTSSRRPELRHPITDEKIENHKK